MELKYTIVLTICTAAKSLIASIMELKWSGRKGWKAQQNRLIASIMELKFDGDDVQKQPTTQAVL